MPRFTANDDDSDAYGEQIDIKHFNVLNLSPSNILTMQTDVDWLKEAARKKGLKLAEKSSSMIVHSPRLSLRTQPYSPRPSPISTDFEWPKISAIQKGFELSAMSTSLNEQFDTESLKTEILNSTIIDPNEVEKNSENNSNSINKDTTKRKDIVFSTKKLLLENELLRRENVKKEVERKKENMEKFSQELVVRKALMNAILAQQRQEEQLKNDRLLEAEEEDMNEKMKQSEIRRKHEQKMHKQRIQEQLNKLEHEQAEYAQKMREKEQLLEKIQPCPTSFQTKFENINALISSCKDRNMAIIALKPYYLRLKELGQQMDIIREKTQMGEITINDVHIAEDILRSLDEIIKQYTIETERIDSAFDAEIARRVHEYNQAELQLQAAQANSVSTQLQPQSITSDQVDDSKQIVIETAVPTVESHPKPEVVVQQTAKTTAQDDLNNFVNPQLWAVYTGSKAYLEQFQLTHQEFLHNEALKKFRFDCLKAIITPVNALNAATKEHLMDKYNRITNFLLGKSLPNVRSHPQGISFSIYTLAKKLVSQGETLISSKPENAFNYASFAVAIWMDYPDFGDMLMAHFHKACPYVVPIWISQLEPENTDLNKNLKKNSGILRLYASIIVSRPRQTATSKSHPHGLGNAWRWFAATLNIEPRADIAEIMATLILDMLEVVGHSMLIAYPKQFPKLLTSLRCEYFPKLKKLSLANEVGGPITRLEEFLEKSITSGTILPPTGLLPPNYW